MDALRVVTQRNSVALLQEPAPAGSALDNIMQAALRAPDHAGLQPWRHIVVTGAGLDKLGEIFVKAAEAKKLEPAQIQRAAKLPHRAPMVIISVVRLSEHPKVPHIEQFLSAGCAVMAMQQAAQAQGFGGMWRTGSYAYDDTVKTELGLAENEAIVSFLYLGTPKVTGEKRRHLQANDYFSFL